MGWFIRVVIRVVIGVVYWGGLLGWFTGVVYWGGLLGWFIGVVMRVVYWGGYWGGEGFSDGEN